MENLIWEENDEVNSLEAWSAQQAETPAIETNSLGTPAIKNYKINSLETSAIESHSNTTQGLTHTSAVSHHKDEKAVFILLLTGDFTVWFLF